MKRECEGNTCNLGLSEEAVGGILGAFSHDRILMLLRSHERAHFLRVLDEHGYKLAIVKKPTA